jgi:hypothetical protein
MSGSAPPEPLPFQPADVTLDYSLRQRAWAFANPFERAAEQWHVKVTAETMDEDDGGADRVYEVGWATVTLLRDDGTANLYEVLDSIDGDHETIGAVIFDADTGKLTPELAVPPPCRPRPPTNAAACSTTSPKSCTSPAEADACWPTVAHCDGVRAHQLTAA